MKIAMVEIWQVFYGVYATMETMETIYFNLQKTEGEAESIKATKNLISVAFIWR